MTDAFVTAEIALREAAAALEAGVRANGSPTMITDGEIGQLAQQLAETLDTLLLLLGTVDIHPGASTDQQLNDTARHIFAAADSADTDAQGAASNNP